MSSPLIELRGLKAVDGRVVQVGKATQENDHGNPFWLCQTQPPLDPLFQPVDCRLEAIQWLTGTCGAEEILEGAVVPDGSAG